MSARRYAKSQKLTADERARLESIASSPEQPAALKRRAKIILWTEPGERWSARTLGEATHMSKTTVWRYLRLHGAEPHRDKRVTSSEQRECLLSPSHTHNEKGN